ncbi:MAG: PQQ-binding-like beta-propeller repeat protein [Patescibacteria group bacterium]|nr:PQQ-binding-like beta-propeller repeat protein [Patescibacteria group bacterium]
MGRKFILVTASIIIFLIGLNLLNKNNNSINLPSKIQAQTLDSDWPQLGHDSQKSNATNQIVNGPYRFYWRWTDVPIASRIQPVIFNGTMFVGGLNGTFYALDAAADTRGQAPRIVWQRDLKDPTGALNSPIRSGAGVDDATNTVVVGTQHGVIYGLDIATGNVGGSPKWTVQTGGAILASPLMYNGVAYLGSSDGNFYAINTADGNVLWKHPITDPVKGNVPILGSAALSADGSRLFFVAENVQAYALNTADGSESWNQQLQGQSGADRWPVVLGNTVVFRTQPIRNLWDLLHEGDTVMDSAGTVLADWSADWNIVRPQIINNLTASPVNQTLFVLDVNTGQSKGVAPVLATYGTQDPPAPPTVYNQMFYLPYRARHGIQTDGGSVHVTTRYDAELGRMDPTTLDIAGLTTADTFTYQFRMTSDEQSVPTLAGNLLLMDSWERLGGVQLTASTNGNLVAIAQRAANDSCGWGPGGNQIVFSENCPSAGPLTTEGRARAGAVVGSGRIFWHVDAVTDANGSGYEFSGSGLGAIGPATGGTTIPLPAGTALSPISPLPSRAATPSAQALLNYITTEPTRPVAAPTDLTTKLEQEIQKIVSANGHLLPLFIQPGGFNPLGSYPQDTNNPPEPAVVAGSDAFWFDPGEQVLTLSQAYPYLNPTLQGQLKTYLQTEINRFSPLQMLPYGASYGSSGDWLRTGVSREFYPVTIRSSLGTGNLGSWPPPAPAIQTIYSLWAYAKYVDGFGPTSYVATNWTSIKNLFDAKKGTVNNYARIAGAIGYSRIAAQLGHTAEATEGQNVAIAAMQNGVNFQNWLDVADNVYTPTTPDYRQNQLNREPGFRGQVFFGLTPEIGRFLRDTNNTPVNTFINRLTHYTNNDYLWYVTRVGIQGEAGENSFQNPELGWSVFLAQAYINGASQQQLRYWLDRPWGLGDLWYLQKLVATIEAPSSAFSLADINQDSQVNIKDMEILFDNWNMPKNRRADINGDGIVNSVDFALVLKDWGKVK